MKEKNHQWHSFQQLSKYGNLGINNNVEIKLVLVEPLFVCSEQ